MFLNGAIQEREYDEGFQNLCNVHLRRDLSRNLKNERKSEQAHIPHAPTLLENAVYIEWQFQAFATGNRTKKGYKLLLKRIKSAFPVKMHIYTLCPS